MNTMIIKDIIIIAILLIVFALAIGYIVKAKKSGIKCIGCPHAKECCMKGKTSCADN